MPFLVESVIEFQMDGKSRWFFWNEVIAQADNFLGLFIRQSFHEPQINDKTNHFKRIIVTNFDVS